MGKLPYDLCFKGSCDKCVRVCLCVVLTPTPPHGNITNICCGKIPVKKIFRSENSKFHKGIFILWYLDPDLTNICIDIYTEIFGSDEQIF